MNNHEVLIIGSGPAGLSAAITCIQLGLKAAVITPQSLNVALEDDFTPLESVHPGIATLLESLDAMAVLKASTIATYTGITIDGNLDEFGKDEQGPWYGSHINKPLFDRELLKSAKLQGVQILEGEKVDKVLLKEERIVGVKTVNGKEILCRYLIDASGHAKITGKRLKLREQFYSPPLVVWTGVSRGEVSEFIDQQVTKFTPEQEGWNWIAAQSPTLYSWTRLSAKGVKDFLPPEELINCKTEGHIKVANMQWRIFRPIVKEGLILCGDAAGILDPAAGQGILNAIYAGIMAARTTQLCFRQPVSESIYLAQYDDWFLQQYENKASKLKQYYKDLGIKIDFSA